MFGISFDLSDNEWQGIRDAVKSELCFLDTLRRQAGITRQEVIDFCDNPKRGRHYWMSHEETTIGEWLRIIKTSS